MSPTPHETDHGAHTAPGVAANQPRSAHVAEHASADGHGHQAGHDEHDDHGHDKHAGHDPEMFRRRFWLSLVLTIPLVVTSHMVMDWFGYTLDFPGHVLGRADPRVDRVPVGRVAVPRRAASRRSATASRG